MLKSLKLQNVVSHKNSELNFCPGVNMIIGPSGQGKSVIINSLIKLATNRPLGDEWRSHWKGDFLIELALDDYIIQQGKGAGSLYYDLINKKTKKKIHFDSVKTGVPIEISSLLNLDRKINFQHQLEKIGPIFLVSESPGEVAKHFNKVAGIYQINTCLDLAKKEVSQSDKQIKIIEKQIKEKQEELKTYHKIKALNHLIQKASVLEKEITSDQITENMIFKTLENLLEKIKKINKIKKKLKIKKEIKKALNLYNDIENQKSEIKKIDQQITLFLETRQKFETITENNEIRNKIKRGLTLLKIYQIYTDQIKEIKTKIKMIQEIKTNLKKLMKIKNIKMKKYNKLLGNVCPFCNSILKDK